MTAKRVLNRVLSRRSDQTADPHLPRGSSKLGPRWKNVAELIDHLGGISADRIRLYPTPGTATETDYLRVIEGIDRWPAELIDGVIVESALYARSSVLATYVLCRIANWVHEADAGICVGGMCPFRFRRSR